MKYINSNKINEIKDNFYIIIDFDQTITSKDSANSWEAILNSKYIKKEHLIEQQKLYEKYKPIEINQTLDLQYRIEKLDEWYSLICKEFYEYDYNSNIIEKAVKDSKLKFRDGAIDFFNKLYRNNIPIIIVSAGIENTIEEFLKLNNIYYSNVSIVSNKMDFENKNTPNYVHALNKDKQIWKKDIVNAIATREYAVLIGDSIADVNMLPNNIKSKKISIGFLDNDIEKNLDIYNKYFDIVLTDNTSFKEVERLLKI